MKNHFVHKIYPKNTLKRLEKKVLLLGSSIKYSTTYFLNARLLIAIVLFLLLFFTIKHGYIIAPIVTIIFYISVEIIVFDLPMKKRGKKLEEEAIFFFEVLNLTLETSRNIKSALELTANNIDSDLSLEFRRTLSDVKMGKSFTESLEDMKKRIPSDTINNIILSLTESSIFGNNITETLENQLDYMRETKLLETKAEITKLPTKISVISVIFFIPIILLIILAPVLVDFLIG